MNDYKALLAVPRFRAFWLAQLTDSMGSWALMAVLPVLVAQRYGTGLVFVLSMGVRILPKLLLAPLASRLLRRFGPSRVAGIAIAVSAVPVVILPWCENLVLTQVLIAWYGAMDVFAVPGFLAMRGAVTPPDRSLAGNTICSVADRIAKMGGPAMGGLLAMAGLGPAFVILALLLAVPGLMVFRLNVPAEPEDGTGATLGGYVRLIRGDVAILALMAETFGYIILVGGLRPFLFWANRDWWGGSDTGWSLLLTAQGAGALIGAAVTAVLGGWMKRAMTSYTLTMTTGILEGAAFLAMLTAPDLYWAIFWIVLAGIPEIMSASSWFAALQERITPGQQAVFYAYTAPLWDLCFALGVASAGLHAEGAVSLSGYWAAMGAVAILPCVPALFLRRAVRLTLLSNRASSR
jgi:hypothetical protein